MTDNERQVQQRADWEVADKAHSLPYPVSRLAPRFELVDLAREIGEADQMLTNVAAGKLRVIAEQVRALQAEARRVLEEIQRDRELHRAECRTRRIPGKVYHLYQREDGSRYFSLLSPDEWNGKAPHLFAGSYRLESDMSWQPVDVPSGAEGDEELINRLLDTSVQERLR